MPLSKHTAATAGVRPANDAGPDSWIDATEALRRLYQAEADLERMVRAMGLREASLTAGSPSLSRDDAGEARALLADVNHSFKLLRTSIAVLEALVGMIAPHPRQTSAPVSALTSLRPPC